MNKAQWLHHLLRNLTMFSKMNSTAIVLTIIAIGALTGISFDPSVTTILARNLQNQASLSANWENCIYLWWGRYLKYGGEEYKNRNQNTRNYEAAFQNYPSSWLSSSTVALSVSISQSTSPTSTCQKEPKFKSVTKIPHSISYTGVLSAKYKINPTLSPSFFNHFAILPWLCKKKPKK